MIFMNEEMSKSKQRFIKKLEKKSKSEIITMFCHILEENYALEREIKRQKHITFSHEIVLKSLLSHVSPIDIDIDDDETDEITTEDKETLRSYV